MPDCRKRRRNASGVRGRLRRSCWKTGRFLPPSGRFLQTGSDAAIWERLIAPVEWDTEAEEAPEVIREIKDRLVVLGQTMGVTPDKAEDVAARLYEGAHGAATRQKDRFLTRPELLRVFPPRTHR